MSGLRRKSRRLHIITGITVFLIMLFLPDIVMAKEPDNVMQSLVNGNYLQLYIRGSEDYDEITAQIGMTSTNVISYTQDADINTIILIDNSLSITEQNQGRIYDFIEAYAQQKDEKEKVSVAAFGEDIEYLVQEETGAEKITEAVGKIEYRNQDSFLTDILYDEIIKLEEKDSYIRFIIITDGVDNKAIGYTKEELQGLLKKKNYPIYALGCIYKENSVELENLFSIARLTQGKYFILDEYETFSEIIEVFDEQIDEVILEIPESCRDGSEKNVLLTLKEAERTVEMTSRAVMPFQLKEETEEKTEEESVLTEQEPEIFETENDMENETVLEKTEIMEEPDSEENEIDIVSIAAVCLIIAALAFLIIQKIMDKRKHKQGKGKGEKNDKKKLEDRKADNSGLPNPAEAPKKNMPSVEDMGETMLIQEGTVFIPDSGSEYILVLQDKKDKNKVFRYPLRGGVVVGRKREAGAQIVLNYEPSVSGRHCRVTVVDGRFFVEDLKSANGTYLNGEIVRNKREFISGSTLEMGNVEMIIEVVRK